MFFDDDRQRGGDQPWYDEALVCANGHTINDAVKLRPIHNKKFCTACGAAAIAKCTGCGAAIRGDYHVSGVIAGSSFQVPAYCHECGAAYPWTEARLRAASELIELSEADAGEQKALKEALPALAGDTPQAKVAATRMRRFLTGAGKQVGDTMKQLLVDVVAESVKKILFP